MAKQHFKAVDASIEKEIRKPLQFAIVESDLVLADGTPQDKLPDQKLPFTMFRSHLTVRVYCHNARMTSKRDNKKIRLRPAGN